MKFLIVFSCLLAVACASGLYGHNYGYALGHNYGHHGLVAHAPIVSHTVAAAPVAVKTIIPATYTSHVVSAPVLSHGYGLNHLGYGHGAYLNGGLLGHGLLGHHGLALSHGGLLIKK